jgi:hypothetical protein
MLRRVVLVRTDISEERIVFLRSMLLLLVTANVVPISPIPVTLMMEAMCPFETSVLTRGPGRHILEVGILHSHRR